MLMGTPRELPKVPFHYLCALGEKQYTEKDENVERYIRMGINVCKIVI